MQPPVARDAIAKNAIQEAQAVTRMAKGRETTRVPGLTDRSIIEKHFGNDYVLYDYRVGDRHLTGVIVPRKLAESFSHGSNHNDEP